MDQAAEGRVTRVAAVADDRVRAQRLDRLLDLDVEVVDRHHQVRNELRLEHEAHGVGVRDFGLQRRVATDLRIDLRSRVDVDVAELRRGDTGVGAERRRVTVDEARRRIHRTPARVGRAARADDGRGVQVADGGRADRAVVAAAEPDVLNRRPLDTKLVGVGVEARRVRRVAVASLDRQVVRARLLVDEGHVDFGEAFRDVELAVDRVIRAVATRREAVAEDVVRIEVVDFLAVLGTDVDDETAGRCRRLDAVLAEVTRDRTRGDVLRRLRLVARRDGQVVEGRRRDAARHPDVPGYAVRVRAVQLRDAGRIAVRAGHDVERVGDLLRARKLPSMSAKFVMPT